MSTSFLIYCTILSHDMTTTTVTRRRGAEEKKKGSGRESRNGGGSQKHARNYPAEQRETAEGVGRKV